MPWAALPWMIGLMRKALKDGWRYRRSSLAVHLVGGVNATACSPGSAPLWIIYSWLVRASTRGR
jgi:hypothetical protein